MLERKQLELSEFFTLDNSTANINWDLKKADVALLVLNSNKTLNLPLNPDITKNKYYLIVKQDSTGGRLLTYNSNIIFTHGYTPVLNSSPNSFTILKFIYSGTGEFICTNDINSSYANNNLAFRAVHSNTLYVSADGSDTTAIRGRMDRPSKTISDAITKSVSGDIIKVFKGTYTENIILPSTKNLDLDLTDNVTINGSISINLDNYRTINIYGGVSSSITIDGSVSRHYDRNLNISGHQTVTLTGNKPASRVNKLDLKNCIITGATTFTDLVENINISDSIVSSVTYSKNLNIFNSRVTGIINKTFTSNPGKLKIFNSDLIVTGNYCIDYRGAGGSAQTIFIKNSYLESTTLEPIAVFFDSNTFNVDIILDTVQLKSGGTYSLTRLNGDDDYRLYFNNVKSNKPDYLLGFQKISYDYENLGSNFKYESIIPF